MYGGFLKRLGAYIIDFIIITLVINLSVRFLPNNSKMVAFNNENSIFMEEYFEVISSGDVEKLEEVNEELDNHSYKLAKISIPNTLFSIVIYFLYFIVFQRYNNGQTVGKKLLKIELVDSDGNVPSFKQMLIRGLIIYPIILELVNILLLQVLSKSNYLNVSTIISMIQFGIYFICLVSVIIKKRGLHDVFAGTNVIKFGTISEVEESNVSKWKKTLQQEQKIKNYRGSHTSGTRKG